MIGEDVMVNSSETDHLRQQLLQAQRLSSVGALASSVAHEFNNILTTIINYAKLAQRSGKDEAARDQALEKILKGSHRAATIISSMLGFARNNSTQREMTDLVALIEEVLLLTDKDLSKHRVQVEKHFQGRPKAPVVPGQIEQVLLNLIINARQAMPNGGRVMIRLTHDLENDMVDLVVRDNGAGIPADKLPKIFEPFYTTKQAVGTGLGLWVTKELVQKQGGSIRVRSKVGVGTVFSIVFPVATETCQIGIGSR